MKIFLKLLRESFGFAFQSVIVNKVRTLLSLLGITIGIFSVISVLTIFDSMEIAIRSSLDELGENVLFVQKWPWAMGGDYPWWKYFRRPETSLKELREIEKRSITADASCFMFKVSRTLKYKNNSIENTNITAVSHDYYRVMPFNLSDGRYFTALESQNGRNVAIIGESIAKELYEGLDPINRDVKIFGSKLKVIGVMKKEGENMFGDSPDEQVFIPVNFARNYVDMKNIGTSIIVRAKPGISNDEMRDEITGIMRSVRKLKPKAEDSFAINETSILSQGFDQVFGVISIVGWVVGGFSLLVGGFGIANIMFVSVKERTSQIGIQMSLGAKRFFILFQFLFESFFLSLFGGAMGLLIVYVLVLLSQSFPFTLQLTANNIIIGMGVAGGIGLLAGIIPSYSASRLDPVEAMRTTF
ncbi:MAG: FtsX-like permease family protein [Chlorobi bacterium]|nr:FtsX-like permease family protein [Chlorobiota bacterium]